MDLKNQVHWYIRAMPTAYISDIETLKSELKTLGLIPTTAYLFLNGHFLLEKVVLPILRPTVAHLRKQKIASFEGTEKQIRDKKSEYKNQKTALEILLTTHKGYTNSIFYQKIQEKVSSFSQKHHF